MFHLWKQAWTSHYLLIWTLHLLQVITYYFLLKSFFFLEISKTKQWQETQKQGFCPCCLNLFSQFIILLSSPFPLKLLLYTLIFFHQVCKPWFLISILDWVTETISLCPHGTRGLHLAWTHKYKYNFAESPSLLALLCPYRLIKGGAVTRNWF